MPYKDPEKRRAYMKKYRTPYMRKYRQHLKAKHDLQKSCEDDIIKRFILDVPVPPTDDIVEISRCNRIASITYASLFKAGRKIRDVDDLEEIKKIYKDVEKELELEEAKSKET